MSKRVRLGRVLVVLVAAWLLPPLTTFAQAPEPRDRVLPDYDIRLLAPRIAPALPADAQEQLESLRQGRSDVHVRLHPFTPGVRSIEAGGQPILPADARGSDRITRGFLARYHRLLGLDARDVRYLVKSRAYRSHNDPLEHVTFTESRDGVEVIGAALQIHLTAAGAIVSVSNSTVPLANVPDPSLSVDAAVQAAIADVRPDLAVAPTRLSGPSGNDQRTTFARGGFLSEIVARLVILPMAGGARPAWMVTLEPPGPPQKYDVTVDAVTGEILTRRNRILYIDGAGRVLQSDATHALDPRRPDAHPVGSSPAGAGDQPDGCPPVANHALRSLTAPFRDSATVLSNTGRLSGNNVHVFRNAQGVEGAAGTLQADGWHFDFGFNTADAAETHLFFLGNFLHDFFYDLGFDEAAGNFQVDNFGRGGLGGDPLVALARADGRNNATFEPNPDGQTSIMSMFLWDGHGCWAQDVDGDGASDIDGDLDADIVIHEFHHGVSNRLNPQFTGIEADAIGEGGSDFFAYSITGDTTLAEYSSPPTGIRQINDKTYADWFCLSFFGFVLCEPHSNGEIWADVMWDLRERFRGDLVGGSSEAAIGLVHQLYVDGLKLSPPAPTMLDLRDAILTADTARNPSPDPGGSANHCRIWEVFAGRGMGWAARDTNATGTASVVADYTVAPECPAPPPPPQVSVTASPSTASEAGQTPATFEVTRSGDTSRTITVHLSVGGTATSGTDYQALPATVDLPAGVASAHVILTPIDDDVVENDETVILTVTGGLGYQVGSPSSATVTIVSDDVAPDLAIASVSAPFYLGAGVPFQATGSTVNQGTGASSASSTRFYLSTDIWLDASDLALGSVAVPPLGVGAAQSFSVSLTLPASTATGIYYVLAQADADDANHEISETNNVRFAPVRVGPDLTVASLTAPATAGAGSAFVVTDSTKNAGAGSAPASVTRLYLSTNGSLDAGDTALAMRSVPALAPGASNTGIMVVTIPASTVTGTYYLIAAADADNAVAEVNELNNTTWSVLRVGPDLVVTSASVTGTPSPGGTITVNDTTKNQGASASVASTTRIYLSTDTTVDASDAVLGGRAVPALGGGASSSGSTSVVIPSSTATGTYYVLVQADGLDANAETNESNNVAWVLARIGPDLVSTVTAPSTASPGGSLTVSDTAKNQGTAPAGASTTRFYLSTDLQLDGGDVPLGSRGVPSLGVGASSAATTSLTLPGGLATGTYYVIALADADGAVPETVETNNTSWSQTRVGPDLVISSVFVSGVLQAGGAFTATDTTRNQGSGSAGASTTRYYFSTNPTLDASDVLLGGRAVPALAASGSQSGSAVLTLPGDVAGGSYYLLVVADGESVVDETSEANNVYPAVIRVGPDLFVSQLSVSGSAPAGGSVTITDTTKNQGAPSETSTTYFYLTADFALDGSDTLLGTRTVGPLGTNAGSTGSTVVTLPSGLAPGKYYVLALADGDHAVAESNESNNQVFAAVQILP